MRKALQDPPFIILLLVNAFCIYYFDRHPEGFKTVVWIYWVQSVLIGVFNFFDLLTIKKGEPDSFRINDKPYDNSVGAKGCAAFFFLFHYQVFHLVYAIFIVVQVKGSVDFRVFVISIAIIALELSINFVRNKIYQQKNTVNVGHLFFLPYLRIIPMHLMILLPAFLGLQSSMVFLVLKSLADIGMYFLTGTLYRKNPGSVLDSLTKP